MRSSRYRTSSLYRLAVFGVTLLLFSGIAVTAWMRDDVHAAGAFASPAFQAQWQAGEAITQNFWGPLQNARDGQQEPYQDAPGGQRLVQYFDKGRMELNDPATGVVTSGLLATELITGRLQAGDNTFTQLQPAAVPVAGDPDNIGPTYASIGAAQLTTGVASTPGAQTTRLLSSTGTLGTYSGGSVGDTQANIGTYDPDTQHNVAAAFVAFRNKVNLLNVGFAISEPFWSTVKVGGVQKDVLVQAFQRRVLTYTPSNPAAFQVEFGNIGQHYYNWRYSGAAAALPTATTVAAAISAPSFTNVTDTTVTVVYTTTFPACGTAEYRVLGSATWITNIGSITCASGSASTTQSVNLTGLIGSTTYEIRPAVKDVAQNITDGPVGTVTTAASTATAAPTTAAPTTAAPTTAAPTTAAPTTAAPTTAAPTTAAPTAPTGPTPNPLPSRAP